MTDATASVDRFNPHPSCLLGATSAGLSTIRRRMLIQSSPKLSPGCDRRTSPWTPPLTEGFNPHPSCLLGATTDQQRTHWRPDARFNPHPSCLLGATVESAVVVALDARDCFNPHPSCLLGATTRACTVRWYMESGFNPHPSCLLGATSHRKSPRLTAGAEVSILTQVVSWVRRRVCVQTARHHCGVSILTQVVSWVRHAALAHDRWHRLRSFNPHPSCLLGATLSAEHSPHAACDRVSILTQVVSWVRRRDLGMTCERHVVSILTQVVSWVRQRG